LYEEEIFVVLVCGEAVDDEELRECQQRKAVVDVWVTYFNPEFW
jgi:hypothetical protein